MDKIRLGSTDIMVTRSGFGTIPIQRLGEDEAVALLRAAYDAGINFFDTARGYSTSERRLGLAFSRERGKVVIATKSHAADGAELEKDLATSLSELNTDYIDVYQFHNPTDIPRPGGENGLYDAALRAKAAGKIRHIGISSHRLDLAVKMVESGLFETLQFPMSSLATDEELSLVRLCRERDVGFIAMKALAGGLITNARTTFSFLRQFDNVVPIWGIQYPSQLAEFVSYELNPPALDGAMKAAIEDDKAALSGGFCRACGYCLPCPAGIAIPTAARMELLLGRTDWRGHVSERGREMMSRIKDCVNCRHCADHCPYHLDTPALLKANLAYYEKFVEKIDAAK